MPRGFKIGIVVLIIAIVIGLIALGSSRSAAPAAVTTPVSTITDPSALPGLQKGNAPWIAEIPNLKARLDAIGLPALSAEGTVLHIHQHLDIFVNGNRVAVPADIGINNAAQFIAEIHVHDTSGIIHVESPSVQDFTLGQFFDIWGVKFTNSCIGGYCTSGSQSLRVYVNGQLYQGDPRQLVLAAHQEIAIVYGTTAQTPNPVPASYVFPTGE